MPSAEKQLHCISVPPIVGSPRLGRQRLITLMGIRGDTWRPSGKEADSWKEGETLQHGQLSEMMGIQNTSEE